MTRSGRWFPLLGVLAALVLVVGPGAGRAEAAVEIQWWHAMDGALGEWVKDLADGFNKSQQEYKVNAVYKGNYTETMTGPSPRSARKQQPHIVQVFEVGTATMMAARGRQAGLRADGGRRREVRPEGLPAGGHRLLHDHGRPDAVAPAQQLDAGPLLQQGCLQEGRARSEQAAQDLARDGRVRKKIQAAGYPCGFSSQWQQWILLENYSAWHNVPIATKQNGFGGFDTELL